MTTYSPELDGEPDPGEVVWAWVPYEDDPSQGKDRPVLVIGREGTSLACLRLAIHDDRVVIARLQDQLATTTDHAREDQARLLDWELVLPDADQAAAAALSLRTAGHAVEEVARGWAAVDPWGTRLILTVGTRC